MHRNRRLVLTDRLIPFLAALVGLIALGGAVLVQVQSELRGRAVADELAAMRVTIEALATRQVPTPAPATPVVDERLIEQSNQTIEAMLALQERMDRLESDWAAAPKPATGPALPGNPASGGFSVSSAPAGAPDPSWPTDDCIPLGTRFMVSVGDEVAICQSPVVVKPQAITGDNVMFADIGLVTETAFKTIPGSNCQLTVYTAEPEGFAEIRVSCL